MKLQISAIEEDRDRQTSQLRQALTEERDALTQLQNQFGESERSRRTLQQSLQERQDSLNQLTQKYEALQVELGTSKNVSNQLEMEIESLREQQRGS